MITAKIGGEYILYKVIAMIKWFSFCPTMYIGLFRLTASN